MIASLLALVSLLPQGTHRIPAVEELRVSGTMSYRFAFDSTQNQGISAKHAEQMSSNASFRGTIKRTLVDDAQVEWTGQGELNYSIAKDKRSLTTFPNFGFQSEHRTDSGNGATKVDISLTVDLESKSYQWSVTPSDPEAGFPSKTSITKTGTGIPSKTAVLTPQGSFPEIAINSISLPDGVIELAGAKPVNTNKSENPMPGLSVTETSSRTTTWCFSPTSVKDHELIIVPPPGWQEWLPNPYIEAGRAVEVELRVQKKGGGPPTLMPKTITVRLSGTSAEPGECLNKNTTGLALDVAIFQTIPSSDSVSEAQVAEINMLENGPTTAKAVLLVKDAAALTHLSASCLFVDGRVTAGKVQDSGEPELSLPRDRNLNRIGDAWEEAMNCPGISPLEDEDQQAGNLNKGDGLTAFEEYRTICTGGKLVRTLPTAGGAKSFDPRRKDLVVINAGADAMKPGFAFFEKHSGIGVVHTIPGDLPESRIVNSHSGTGNGGEQHGVLVEINEKPDPNEEKAVGATSGPAGDETNIPSPKACKFIRIAPAKITRLTAEQAEVCRDAGFAMPYTAAGQIAETVAHELAHSTGVHHHSDDIGNGDSDLMRRIVNQDTTRLLDQNGRHQPELIPMVSGNDPQDIGVKPSVSSGDIECIMCYRNYYQWMKIWQNDKHYYVKLVPLAVGDRFCTSGEATGWNAPRNELPGFFGPAAPDRGNCLGSMLVKDW
jgi:hypothetical protein